MARMVASSLEYQAGTRFGCLDLAWIKQLAHGVQGMRLYVAFAGGCTFSSGGRLVCQTLK